MTWIEIFLLGIALAMDAFAVSLGKGMASSRLSSGNFLRVGLWFGIFQAIMPLAGYFLANGFADLVEGVDHWIAFGLLALVGGNMIRESAGEEDGKEHDASFGVRTMFVLAVATSIDALAAGVSMAFLNVSIWRAVLTIGVVTAVLSATGLFLGHKAGCRFHKGAGIAGGAVLIAIGVKVLVEHLFF